MPTETNYERFLELHHRDRAFVMPNPWDGLSALTFADAGFEALGTSSAALAATLGRLDGRGAISREEHLEHAVLLGELTGLPVNGDVEDGYGESAADVADTVEAAVAAGLGGIGIEDTSGDPADPIRGFDEAVERMRHAVAAGRGRIVITGRTDNFIQGRPDLDDTVRRLVAFAEVGADVLYAPRPPDLDAVVTIVDAVAPKPVNVIVSPADRTLTVDELAAVGVKRISFGPSLFTHVAGTLRSTVEALQAGDIAAATSGPGIRDLAEVIRRRTDCLRRGDRR